MPTTLSQDVLDWYIQAEESRLDVRLQLLMLMKAELSVKADRLGGELEFWVGVWKDIKGWDESGKKMLPQGPFPGVFENDERVFLVGSRAEGIQRKEVPVTDMLKRAGEESVD